MRRRLFKRDKSTGTTKRNNCPWFSTKANWRDTGETDSPWKQVWLTRIPAPGTGLCGLCTPSAPHLIWNCNAIPTPVSRRQPANREGRREVVHPSVAIFAEAVCSTSIFRGDLTEMAENDLRGSPRVVDFATDGEAMLEPTGHASAGIAGLNTEGSWAL